MAAKNKARAKRRNEARREARALAAVTPKASKTERQEKLSDRDGLEWLVDKGRLKGHRLRAARWLRRIGRDAALDDGASIKSNLNRTVGGGRGDPPALVQADASIKLRFVRAVFGVGAPADRQREGFRRMLELLDGVVIGGRTVLEMDGGDDRKSLASEAVLGIALDLVSLAQAQQEAAEKQA